MELINHQNGVFKLSISDYMSPFNPDQYYESNWLKGTVQISQDGQTKVIQLESLQIEELMQLSDWIEQLTDKEKRTQTIFNFIDPNMKFRLWKRGRIETIRFIYHSEQKDIYSWEMILNDRNVTNFKRQVNETLVRFPLR